MNVCKFARSVKLHRSNPPPESPAMPHATFACLSRPAVRLAAGVLAAGVLAGCGQGQPGGGHGGFPPAQVTAIAVAPRTLPVSWEYVGQTTGSKDVEVRARVTGILERKLYAEGSAVKAGQPLFTIDPKPLEAQASHDPRS